MLLIPAFVILVVYGDPGWALVVFVVAGITDGLDGLIARRAARRRALGAWLDPMADKLLLVTTFIVLTLPGTDLVNRLPSWLTILVISRDVVIVLDGRDREPGGLGRRTFRPSIFGKIATATYIITCVVVMFFNYLAGRRCSSTPRSGCRWRSRWSRASTTSRTRPDHQHPQQRQRARQRSRRDRVRSATAGRPCPLTASMPSFFLKYVDRPREALLEVAPSAPSRAGSAPA